MTNWILRHVTDVDDSDGRLALTIDGLEAVEVGGTPGWLTGEKLLAQGVEVNMPNLPKHLAVPDVDARRYRCQVTPIGRNAVRIVIAPEGHRVLNEPLEWLGIVIDTPAPADGWRTEIGERDVQLIGPAARLKIGKSPFSFEFAGVAANKRVALRTAERLRQVAGFPMAPPVLMSEDSITLNLELDTDEDILGFGEQFGRLVKNGQRLRLHTEDALGTGTGMAYKPVPMWHSTNGYLGFVNTGATLDVDVAHVRPSVLSITSDGTVLDLVLIADDQPAKRLAGYTELTGRAGVPPLWAFGYWIGKCRYHSNTEMLEVADRMRELEVPGDVLHVDPDWLVLDRLNTDFIWNEERFGPLTKFVNDLRDRKFRLSVWEVPYLDPRSPAYEHAAEKGYLVMRQDGSHASVTGTPTPDGLPRGLVDFTNPDAKAWWQEKHKAFLDAGVAVFKTDFGEGCPDNAATFDQIPNLHSHNLYTLRYNGAVHEAIAKYTDRNALVWGRSGWAGSQRYPGQWGGDAESTVVGMQATLRGGLSYAISAPGFWSHDIGGFFGPELTPALYVRWTQFGALSPLMRAHGLRPREPWQFGEQALSIAKDWIKLRYSLLPYLWQAAHDCERNGLPMLRPLALEFPEDPITTSIDDQFLLGRDLLVAPIFDDGVVAVQRRIYLPEGTWWDFFTDEKFEGPGFITRSVPLAEMPVFVREGAVIPRVDVAGVRSTDDVMGRPWEVHTWSAPNDPIRQQSNRRFGLRRQRNAPSKPGTLIDFDGKEIAIAELESKRETWTIVKHD